MTKYEKTDDYVRQMFAHVHKVVVSAHYYISNAESMFNLKRCLVCRLFYMQIFRSIILGAGWKSLAV